MPFQFVRALNLELTYQCNRFCSHCLQQNIRNNISECWLSTGSAKQVILQAWFSGLVSHGINFTGGEVFHEDSNLTELLEFANSFKIDVRINTNGWWGNRSGIQMGKRVFDSVSHVIGWLKEHNIAVLALSYDERYQSNREDRNSVVSIIRECERVGQNYQIVCTGITEERLLDQWNILIKEIGIVPRHLIPVMMDKIDMGGSSDDTKNSLDCLSLAALPGMSPCQGKGFIRPIYLHVSPNGGLRGCMYAPLAGYYGNVNASSLIQIINHPKDCKVSFLFNQVNLSPFVVKYFEPYAHLYRSIVHPCTASALIARFAEAIHGFRGSRRKDPSPIEIERIHIGIAKEYNLLRQIC